MGSASDTFSRIALACQGTRGDFQPMLSLACGLRKAGKTVKIFSAPGHCKGARELGFDAVAISVEIRDFLLKQRGRQAMEKGDFSKLFTPEKFDDDPEDDDETDWPQVFDDAMEDFAPELILYNGLISWYVKDYLERHKEAPALLVHLQPHQIPSNDYEPTGAPRFEDPDMPKIFRHVLSAQGDALVRHRLSQEAVKKGHEPRILDGPHSTFEEYFCIEECPTPQICAFSGAWWPAPADWPKANIEIVGNLKIAKQQQEELSQSGGEFFNEGGAISACREFLQAGPPPVYIGWGSMHVYSKEHMACLAVRALKEAEQRGIIVGGWANLSPASLAGAEDAAALQAYCEANVLFLKAAPHEWLMPQCSCAIHHGGIGTAQASLSAGVPTIVTPVFCDQYSIAEKIDAEKCGVGTKHMAKVTAEELGAAIRKCCTDVAIKANVKELAERMQQEDGVARTIEVLEDFFRNKVKTGEYQKSREAQEARLREKTTKMEKYTIDRIVGTWSFILMKASPVLKEYLKRSTELGIGLQESMAAGKLWFVKASGGCLARQGESLKSEEAGRFSEYCLLEELAQKGSRLRVKRLVGAGPNEGWVSLAASGKALVAKVSTGLELGTVQQKRMSGDTPMGDPPAFLAHFGLLPPKRRSRA